MRSARVHSEPVGRRTRRTRSVKSAHMSILLQNLIQHTKQNEQECNDPSANQIRTFGKSLEFLFDNPDKLTMIALLLNLLRYPKHVRDLYFSTLLQYTLKSKKKKVVEFYFPSESFTALRRNAWYTFLFGMPSLDEFIAEVDNYVRKTEISESQSRRILEFMKNLTRFFDPKCIRHKKADRSSQRRITFSHPVIHQQEEQQY